MKKFIGIVLFNIILIVLILLLAELTLFTITTNRFYRFFYQKQHSSSVSWSQVYVDTLKGKYGSLFLKPNLDFQSFRKQEKVSFVKPFAEIDKSPIILMGCSFTYGSLLSDEQTFGYKLSEKTNRVVYNLGIRGGSPRAMLYMLRNWGIIENNLNIKKNADYIVYTYIDNHKRRLYDSLTGSDNFSFKKIRIGNTDKLIYEDNNVFKKTHLYKNCGRLFFSKEYASRLFNLYMKEINNEIKTNFKNKDGKETKFVILRYRNSTPEKYWDELRKEGIIILHVDELTNKNMRARQFRFHDGHPNEKAWNEIVPKLVKELNL